VGVSEAWAPAPTVVVVSSDAAADSTVCGAVDVVVSARSGRAGSNNQRQCKHSQEDPSGSHQWDPFREDMPLMLAAEPAEGPIACASACVAMESSSEFAPTEERSKPSHCSPTLGSDPLVLRQ
jgi:hypothetical protein